MIDHDVVVIGAGPVGACTAFELAQRGVDVAVVEAHGSGAGAARNNAGWITPIMAAPVPAPGVVLKAARWMFDPTSPLRVAPDLELGHVAFMFRMLRASTPRRFQHGLLAVSRLAEGTLQLFHGYQAAGVQFEMHEAGVLMAFLTAKECTEHLAEYEHAASFGLAKPYMVDRTAISELEPSLSERVVAGALCPDQMHLDPSSFVDGLATRLDAMAVPRYLHDPVLGLVPRDGYVDIRMRSGSMRARDVVVAAGVGSAALAASAGHPIPLRFGKGYGFDMKPSDLRLNRAVYLSEAKVAVSPTSRGVRLAGTMEFGGDPNRVDSRRAGGILESSRRYFNVELGPAPSPWAGLRPMTPDGLPVIGRLGGASNVILATGHAMLGVTLGPRTGVVVADLVEGDNPSVLLPFSPNRFRRSHRSRSIGRSAQRTADG